MKAILKNGMIFDGTPEEIDRLISLSQLRIQTPKHLSLHTQKPATHYWSSSRDDYVRIEDMHSSHIRNALVKIFTDWEYCIHSRWGNDLIQFLDGGCTDREFLGLLEEYRKRCAE